MSDMLFNLRIGKLHIQVTFDHRVRLVLNDSHVWFKRPFIQRYE